MTELQKMLQFMASTLSSISAFYLQYTVPSSLPITASTFESWTKEYDGLLSCVRIPAASMLEDVESPNKSERTNGKPPS